MPMLLTFAIFLAAQAVQAGPTPLATPSQAILDGEAVVPAGSYLAWRVPGDENPGQAGVLDVLDAEWANVEAALDFCAGKCAPVHHAQDILIPALTLHRQHFALRPGEVRAFHGRLLRTISNCAIRFQR